MFRAASRRRSPRPTVRREGARRPRGERSGARAGSVLAPAAASSGQRAASFRPSSIRRRRQGARTTSVDRPRACAVHAHRARRERRGGRRDARVCVAREGLHREGREGGRHRRWVPRPRRPPGRRRPSGERRHAGSLRGRVQTADDHGTAVAEIVHEMAPDAQLYLVCVGTEVDLAAAVPMRRARAST